MTETTEYGTHRIGNLRACEFCFTPRESIEDGVVSKDCPKAPVPISPPDAMHVDAPVGTVSSVSFGMALVHIQRGGRAQRAGWNGKDMYIWHSGDEPCVTLFDKHSMALWAGLTEDERASACLPYILFKTADNKILMGWLASQTDMLATDWMLLP